MSAGVDEKMTTFIFVDTQIIKDDMLEDINNILNSGDVPGIYKKEDIEKIDQVGNNECIRKKMQPTKMNKLS